MNARLISSLTAMTICLFAGASAEADATEERLAWQEPGYVQEVVYAAQPRFPVWQDRTSAGTIDSQTSADSNLARLEPGYVEEVVIVTASRSEALAEAEMIRRSLIRRSLIGRRRHLMGFPAS